MRDNLRHTFAAAALVFVAATGHAILHAEKTPSLSSAPRHAGQELPDGEGKKELSKICSGCHDLTFTISTRDTEEGWTAIVNDMRSKGADGSDEDFAKIIAYLARYMGKK
jgi:hypothetical protein